MAKKQQDTPTLFSEQELAPENLQGASSAPEGPVTCLGMEFENNDARRAYFREELRKKLPELRHIEGFPIGEDDDIINLSDPPYYTACPNPWLNDFIQEWEQEKIQLAAEGKRSENFEVKEPYASDVSDIKNDSVYRAHMYHTKVPHTVVMRYLLHYTQPGDIVYDGFAGTGMTGVAAQACGDLQNQDWKIIEKDWNLLHESKPQYGCRHAICGDLSPYASIISYNYNTPVDTQVLQREYNRIKQETESECKWMYTTMHEGKPIGIINCVIWSDVLICENCGNEFVYWNAAVDKDNKQLNDNFICPHCHASHNKKNARKSFITEYDDILNNTVNVIKTVPIRIVYTVNKKRYERNLIEYDYEVLSKILNTPIKHIAPKYNLPEGSETQRNAKNGIVSVHQFYTRRNLIALSTFLDKIQHSTLPNKLKFIFTGMINRSTKMNKVHFTKYLNGKSDWDAGYLKGTLYIPPFSVESSVLAQIENKFERYIKAIPMLPKKYDNALYVGSAFSVPLSDNSVDYIFTDPPFGANINYSELNVLPEAWLKVVTNNQSEAIVNETQDKNKDFYLKAMTASFKEYYRILKAGHWMTVEFSNTSAAIWATLQESLNKAGFIISNVSSLNKGQGGMRAVTTTTAVNQDLAITCYKPTADLTKRFQTSVDKRTNVWDFIDELLGHLSVHLQKDNMTTAIVERSPKILFDRLIAYYVQQGYPVPMDAQEFQAGLRERFLEIDGMFFTAQQASEYQEKKKLAPEFVPMGLVVSDEANGIEWLKRELKEPKTYQEIQPDWMQAIGAVRKNDIIPELKQLLDENFIEEENGKWRLPNIQDDKDVNALRTKALLREFKIYVEAASKPKAKIKQARVEALRAGFKDCYVKKDFQTIVTVGDKIPQNLRDEDEVLLQFYDIALNKL